MFLCNLGVMEFFLKFCVVFSNNVNSSAFQFGVQGGLLEITVKNMLLKLQCVSVVIYLGLAAALQVI